MSEEHQPMVEEETYMQSGNGGIGVVGALGVLFVGLKLFHVIDWPWIWVLAPFWVGAILIVVIIAIALIILGLSK